MKRLLCVFAHPDDECYGPGGTIARCVLEGVGVFMTTFTAGEAGSIGVSKTLSRDELARRRTGELAAAAGALGIAGHRMLGAPDGGVARVDPIWAVDEILADIHRFRPHVAITFHRLGVSGHPDHIAVAAFLDRAIEHAGAEGPLVCYEWGIPSHKAPLYERANLVPLEESDVAVAVDIGADAMARKLDAIRCHDTQIEFFHSLEAKFDYREMGTPEYFARGRSRMTFGNGVLGDIFDGIEDA